MTVRIWYSEHSGEWVAWDTITQTLVAHDRQRAEVIKMCQAAGYRVIEESP